MMKHMTFRRLLALLLTLALCLTLTPLTALAGGSEDMPLEVTVFDNNRPGEWGGGETDGYLELDGSGVIRFDVSGAASLSGPGQLKGVWLVDAATRAVRYDLLSASYGGDDQSAVDSWEDENHQTVYFLNVWITGLTISGASVGDYRLKVQVGSEVLYSEAYSDEYYATDGLVHVVAHGSLSSGPKITTGFLTPPRLGKAYSARLEATPEQGGAISWSIAEGSMPPGLTLSAEGLISGTPAEMGTFQVTVKATEAGGGSAEKKFWITVTAPDPEITNPEIVKDHRLPDGNVGTPYSFQLTGKPAFAGDTLKWSIYHLEGYDTGELPPGLSLDEDTGLISGTPTTEGEYHFTPFVTEVETGNGFGPTVYLTIHGISLDPPVITTETLPEAMVSAAYQAQLTATPVYGGAISWSLVSGSLPDGLTLDAATGAITGTPGGAGSYSFTVRATETGGSAAERQFTLSVAPEPLALVGDPTLTLSWAGELLRQEGLYSAVLSLNRETLSGETLTAALEYKDRGGAPKTAALTFSYRGWRSRYLNGYLPADAARIERFVIYLNETELASVPVNADTAPVLRLSFTGNAQQSVWLNVKNAEGRSVYNQYMDGTSAPITLKNLEPGSYTAELTGYVYGFGTLSFGSAAFTLRAGTTTEATMEIGTHRSAVVSPRVTAGGSGLWYYTTYWYADEACTELLSTARSYAVLDDDVVWFVAGPKSSGGVEWTDSEPLRVTVDTPADVEVPLVKKPMISVNITARTEQGDGSGVYAPEDFYVTVARPGLEGYVDSHREYGYAGSAYRAENVTEGAVLTVAARNAWYVNADNAAVSHTVTAAELAAGSLDWDVDIPLTEGRIYLDVTRTSQGVTQSYNRDFPNLSAVMVTKADGTELAISRRGTVVTLLEPEKVSVGETLTLYARSEKRSFGPVRDGSVTLTVETDGEGKKLARGSLELIERPFYDLRLQRTVTGPMSLLVYGSDGSLFAKDDTLYAGGHGAETNFSQRLYGLPADEYTFVLADKRHMDTLAPEDYDSESEGLALPYSGHISADLRNANGSGTITLTDAEAAQEYSRINTELSTVTITRTLAGYITLDLNIIPKPGFAPEGGVTVCVRTNQTGDSHGWGGFVGTRSLSVNGIPVDFNRWGGDYSGMIRTDGSIWLTLSQEQLALYGGFPLRFSTVFTETDHESVVCAAYLLYTQGGDSSLELVASDSQLTGGIRLEVPEATTDGVFTVWGQGAPCTKNIQGYAADKRMDYNVTILADGIPVAQTQVNGVKGYFKAQIVLDAAHMEEGQEVEFVAVGAYDDGSFARVSAPARVAYTPREGVLHDYSLSWESHRGDYEAGRMQTIAIWDDGDPVNLTKSWYRGAGSNDQARLYWTMHFDNPDRIAAVSVVVPRNGYSTVIEAERQEDGSWQTPLTYIPGSAPDGAWVTYSTVEEAVAACDTDAPDYGALAEFFEDSSFVLDVQGDPSTDAGLRFNLSNGDDLLMPVRYTERELPWDETDLTDLQAMAPLYYDDANLIHSDCGYLSVTGGRWAIDLICRYPLEGGSGYLYQRTTTTIDTRTVTTWDAAAQKKTVSVLTLGDGGAQAEAYAEEPDEENRADLRNQDINEVWTAFTEAFTDAIEEAGERAAAAEANAADASLQSIDTGKAAMTAYTIGKECYTWAHGKKITARECSKLQLFIKANYTCLHDARKAFYRDDPRMEVFNELNYVTLKTNTNCVMKAWNTATAFMKGPNFSKGLKAAGKAIAQGARDHNTRTTQGQNLAREIYQAAKILQQENSSSGSGGLCGGFDWSKWPKDLYDPDKDTGEEPKDANVSYDHVQQSPPGPQGRYDPSGYVYEAVPSNRVEGATVTLYTLSENAAEYDASGAVTALNGNAFLADAEEFGIEPNPQTTGADGRYQWFVPLGWWRVHVSAAGYADADSGVSAAYGLEAYRNSADGLYYMPVLPVQLDVNLPLVSYAAPAVESVEATELGVLLRFTKYMDETALTGESFTLLVNGEATDFDLTFVDSERSVAAAEAPSYTRTLLLTDAGARAGDQVRLLIDSRVRSYAGVAMDERYDSGELTVTAAQTVATPAANLASGEVERNTPVALSCATEGAVIRYTVDGTEPTEDSPVCDTLLYITEDVTVKAAAFRAGMLPSAVLTLTYTVPGNKPAPAAVTATVDGRPVESGTALRSGAVLRFTTATEGAEIWYTTNGVCPREDPNPLRYTGPITLEPGAYYFRVRAKLDGVWSDGLPLRFTVGEGDLGTLRWQYDGSGLTVTGSGISADSPVYLALYDAAGRMTAIRQFTASGQTAQVPQSYARAKLIWLGADRAPKCGAVRIG